MRNIATLALLCCLAAAPAAARDGGLQLLAPDPLEVTPGIQHDAQDDSAYASETGFLTRRSLESAQWADTLVLQSLAAYEAEIVSGSGFAAGPPAGSLHRSLFDPPKIGPARPDAGVGAYGSVSVAGVTLPAPPRQGSPHQ